MTSPVPAYETRDLLRAAADSALANLPDSLGEPLAGWLLCTVTSAIATETEPDSHAVDTARALLDLDPHNIPPRQP